MGFMAILFHSGLGARIVNIFLELNKDSYNTAINCAGKLITALSLISDITCAFTIASLFGQELKIMKLPLILT
jgi:hypothetical protein